MEDGIHALTSVATREWDLRVVKGKSQNFSSWVFGLRGMAFVIVRESSVALERRAKIVCDPPMPTEPIH